MACHQQFFNGENYFLKDTTQYPQEISTEQMEANTDELAVNKDYKAQMSAEEFIAGKSGRKST